MTKKPVLILDDLEEVYRYGARKSTPHHEPDWNVLREYASHGGDTVVMGKMVFLEEHNTGYDGILERWLLSIEAKAGPRLDFMVDLLPGAISRNVGD